MGECLFFLAACHDYVLSVYLLLHVFVCLLNYFRQISSFLYSVIHHFRCSAMGFYDSISLNNMIV